MSSGGALTERKTLGLIMLDIDKFKIYNDTYGHPQGDILLQAVAEVLGKTLNRPADFAARWGGEEFMILLPDTDREGTVNIAEQIRVNIKKTIVPCADGTKTSATVSLGADSITPDDGDSSADLIAGVDKLLYAAKNSGRDRTCSTESVRH